MHDYTGTFVWYELMTTDLDAAQAFYASVAGWTVRDSGVAAMDYRLMAAGDRDIGGMMILPDHAASQGAVPGWLGYVAVADVDAAAAKAVSLGGTIHRSPTDIPGIGRFAAIGDPHGAAIVIFTPLPIENPPPPVPMGTDGHIGWNELMAGDLPGAMDFYEQMFGWQQDKAMDMGPMGPYQLYNIQGQMLVGMMKKPDEIPAPPYWGYYINVPSLGAAIERVTAGGGQIVNGPIEVPDGGWVANGLDPQGAYFSIVSMKP